MSLVVAGTDSLTLPVGTTAQRNGTPVTGMTRLNSTTGVTEYYNGTNWVSNAIISGTAVASTSGTSVSFTGIPAGVKRITMMLNGVSTNGTSSIQFQLGSGSATTSGYTGTSTFVAASAASSLLSSGFLLYNWNSAAYVGSGMITFTNLSGNTWTALGIIGNSNTTQTYMVSGVVTLSGVLDRAIMTTVNGTDTFDAGSINILYE
jgi:hypothetical protein